MIVSLNEIEVNLRKAAVGAGLPLGLAEDLGRAATWLSVFDLPALPLCLQALESLFEGTVVTPQFEESEQRDWWLRSDSHAPLSSLYAGSAAGDLLLSAAAVGALPVRVQLDATDSSLLVLAAVCDLLILRQDLVLECACISHGSEAPFARLAQGRLLLSQDPKQLKGDGALVLTLSVAKEERESSSGQDFFICHERAAERGVTVEASDWRRVQQFVAETLVPASELSRLQGAGAGLRDND